MPREQDTIELVKPISLSSNCIELSAKWVIASMAQIQAVRQQAGIGITAWDTTARLINVETELPQQDITK